ncbi:Uncharacterised protein [Exiguobacterium aurantiacum]|uniref:Lipoprotein n=1 Tax=Exiguobacterium aurantiacum TaxID=33987 RepID=A0A377HGY5_9BACL|nr:Uncharacterised protein [Exiguobacterium aurantiacum]STO53247.1 Uncharacterised protein [Exiguobacterium aurantiacum]
MKFTYLVIPLAILLMAGCTSEDTPSTIEKAEGMLLKQKKSSIRLKRAQTTQIRRRLQKSLQKPRKRSLTRIISCSPAIN